MNDIQIFNNPQFGEIRIIADENNEPLFCLADLCAALGIANHRNVKARLDEDDVRLMDTIDNLGRIQQIIYVTECGMYDVVLRSDADNAKPFRRWVTSEVLPSLRKTGSYKINPSTSFNPVLHQAEAQVFLIEQISRNLRLNDVSRLGMYQELAAQNGLTIPSYVKSKGVMKSAKDLLKDKGYKESAIKFNIWLSSNGYIEQKTRPTTGGKEKKFWSITEKGKPYGENNVSPHNPKETQPLWYEDRFNELYSLVKP